MKSSSCCFIRYFPFKESHDILSRILSQFVWIMSQFLDLYTVLLLASKIMSRFSKSCHNLWRISESSFLAASIMPQFLQILQELNIQFWIVLYSFVKFVFLFPSKKIIFYRKGKSSFFFFWKIKNSTSKLTSKRNNLEIEYTLRSQANTTISTKWVGKNRNSLHRERKQRWILNVVDERTDFRRWRMQFPLASNKNRCWQGFMMVIVLLTVKTTFLLLTSLTMKLSPNKALFLVIIKWTGCVAVTNCKKMAKGFNIDASNQIQKGFRIYLD